MDAGHGDVGLTHLERAAGLLRDAPATRSKAYVLCSLARFLRNAGRNEEAIEVGREALAMAEQLGLDELCANALCTLGVARAETGDLGGVEDLERSIVIAQAGGSPESVRALLNLGSILARLGDLPRAFSACGRTPGCGALRRSRRDPVAPGGTAVRRLLVRPH